MANELTLIVESDGGPVVEKTFTPTSPIVVGRDASVDLVITGATGISRKHAEIRQVEDRLVLSDLGSFNGTYVNGARINSPKQVFDGDTVWLGNDACRVRISAPEIPSRDATVVAQPADIKSSESTRLVETVDLPAGGSVTLGRSGENDVVLDSLQISKRHARLTRIISGIEIEDLNSTNGVYIDGRPVKKSDLTPGAAAQLGPYLLRLEPDGSIGLYDTRSTTRIDALNVVKDVVDRSGGRTIRLLDGVSLSIQPNEFVGLLGPSGAGKSTLMDAMNGMRPATGGRILMNGLDLYSNLDAIKRSIGYVPQDDIIHRELTVYSTLLYVAKLRLSRDVTSDEVEHIIEEVLDATGLSERRDVAINQLSGGQRKRVSIAVELITKPSVIFLDEPTSGLDPGTEEKIMKLFRELANGGRTIVLTTHAMENVRLFDKIVVLMRGKLVFYGKPDEALRHVGAESFKELYDRLEDPIKEKVHRGTTSQSAAEQVAEDWKARFLSTPQYRENVAEPLSEIRNDKQAASGTSKSHKLGVAGSIQQFLTLSRRYADVLLRDRMNLLILLAQAPVIALLTFLVMGNDQPRDFAYFILALVAVWFGTVIAAREIIRERPVYDRERMVNVGLGPYVFSKLAVLFVIVSLQCLLLFVPLKVLDIAGVMPMPGSVVGIPQFAVMLVTATVGIALGLLISSVVKTSEMATSIVPLILIPQILFSGLIGVPTGLNRVVGLIMPATWAFDSMKRFSGLDTLEEEGSRSDGSTSALGYYKFIETENDRIIANAKRDVDSYKSDAEKKIDDFEVALKDGRNPAKPKLDDPPKPADARKVDKAEMSKYVNFLHPWMSTKMNFAVLFAMLAIFVAATFIVLRLQEIR